MASSSDVRKLVKAFSTDPALHAAVKAAKTPEEKHAIIRKAGHTPVTDQDLRDELAKSLHPTGNSPTPEDHEFVGSVLHLASGQSSDFA